MYQRGPFVQSYPGDYERVTKAAAAEQQSLHAIHIATVMAVPTSAGTRAPESEPVIRWAPTVHSTHRSRAALSDILEVEDIEQGVLTLLESRSIAPVLRSAAQPCHELNHVSPGYASTWQ